MTQHSTTARISGHAEPGAATYRIEMGTAYTDGYRITVGWSDEDGAWRALLSGMKSDSGGPITCTLPMGHGDTKEAALLDLCCCLAHWGDVLYDWAAKGRHAA